MLSMPPSIDQLGFHMRWSGQNLCPPGCQCDDYCDMTKKWQSLWEAKTHKGFQVIWQKWLLKQLFGQLSTDDGFRQRFWPGLLFFSPMLQPTPHLDLGGCQDFVPPKAQLFASVIQRKHCKTYSYSLNKLIDKHWKSFLKTCFYYEAPGTVVSTRN